MNISVISFDGDMTLWDFYKVMRHSLQQTLAELQRQVPTQRALELPVRLLSGSIVTVYKTLQMFNPTMKYVL